MALKQDRDEARMNPESNWLEKFPAFRGLFTYEVDGKSFPDLGKGLFLWQLDIVANTMKIIEHIEDVQSVHVTCRIRKELLELPSDACKELLDSKNSYVVEQWSGKANPISRGFCMDHVDFTRDPVGNTFKFERMPVLTREVLAGCYELLLNEDGSALQSVHQSWVEAAKLDIDQALGIMLRVPEQDPVVKMLISSKYLEVNSKLAAARKFLNGARVQRPQEKREVVYSIVAILSPVRNSRYVRYSEQKLKWS